MPRQASMLVLLMWLGAAAPAQEAPEPATGEPPAEPAAMPEPEATPEPAATPAPASAATAKSPDSFTPSEEISEDLSVSFPVDI